MDKSGLLAKLNLSKEDYEYMEQFYASKTCNTSSLTVSDTPSTFTSMGPALCNLESVKDSYLPYHGVLAVIVCGMGTVFNLLNIMVLTHKDMKSNPINLILTGIAVADCLVSIEYIPFTFHMYLMNDENRDPEEMFSMAWGIFLLFHTNFTIMIHTVSIWLTLCLAIWRLLMIKFPTIASRLCTLPRCKTLLALGYVLPFILTAPNLLSIQIGFKQERRKDGSCATLHMLQIINQSIFSLNMWLYSFILKLVPCVVLTILTACLINALYKVDENSQKIRIGSNSEISALRQNSRSKSTDKTTKLLAVILILFLVAEFPQGILGMLSAIFGQQFFLECYNPMGEMMDMMALINSAANFLLYFLMSTEFKKTLKKICGIKPKQKKTNVTFTTKLERFSFVKKNVIVTMEEIPLQRLNGSAV